MANSVNRHADPADRTDPTQGRRRECARRLRQMERQRQKALVKAMHTLPQDALSQMEALDDAQAGFLEHTAEQHLLTAGDASPEGYARAILAAAQDLVTGPS